MYKCDLNILLLNIDEDAMEAIQRVEPQEWFTHNFICAEKLQDSYRDKINIVIFRDSSLGCVEKLHKALGEALCIYCTDNASELTCHELELLYDVWPEKLTADTAELLFARLMKDRKLHKDAWLWNMELQAVIDTSLDLIWFKGRFGEHWRVNNVFCDTVKKTKEEIRGKQHYYIWNLTPEEYKDGEYVCLETEQDVKEAGCTCRYREQVKSADGMLELLTHKTPLYDNGKFIGTVGVAKDITKEEAYRKKLLHQACTDELTGLANRRYFYYCMRQAANAPLSLIYFDLDCFKELNDRYGHQAGDAALSGFAALLKEAFSDGTIARMGGDEFVAALPGEYAKDKIRERLEKFIVKMHSFFKGNPKFSRLSASIGVAIEKKFVDQIDELLQKSDLAMYKAKKSGKNCCRFYDEIDQQQ